MIETGTAKENASCYRRRISDADWAGNEAHRKSTPGYYFTLSDRSVCVIWSSKVQSSVATSAPEAETIACVCCSSVCVFVWLAGIVGYECG